MDSDGFQFDVKGLKLQNAKVFLNRLGGTLQMLFQVRTSSAKGVNEVWDYLYRTLPWNLGDYGNARAILSGYDAQAEDENGRTIWVGTAEYVQPDLSEEATAISFDSVEYEEVCWRGWNDRDQLVPILNSAQDRFQDPVKETRSKLIIRVSKCFPLGDFTAEDIEAFRNTVNLSGMTIADIYRPAYGFKMIKILPKVQVVDAETISWRFDMDIEVCPAGKDHVHELLDQGLYEWREVPEPTDSNDSRVLIKVGTGESGSPTKWYARYRSWTSDPDTGVSEPAQEPILLDGTGGRLLDTSPGNEVYLRYRTSEAADWSALALPDTVAETIFGR